MPSIHVRLRELSVAQPTSVCVDGVTVPASSTSSLRSLESPGKQKPALEYVAALDHGIRVLGAFSRACPELTLSEVAALTSLFPSTARRSLHTLERLGFVGRKGRRYLLRPKVLSIGSAYLSAINAREVLEPYLWDVVDALGGSASIVVLDDGDAVCLAHASARRLAGLRDVTGARVPAHATPIGHLLLAFESDLVVNACLDRATREADRQAGAGERAALRRALKQVRRAGHVIARNDQDGVVSVVLPVMSAEGQVVAAAVSAAPVRRMDRRAVLAKRLPVLRMASRGVTEMLWRFPELTHSIVRDPR
jgi:IclR family transcriptional regulator, pca regulon regulatory protein